MVALDATPYPKDKSEFGVDWQSQCVELG